MTDMVTRLKECEGVSLDRLDLSPGLVAFDNPSRPFIIAHPIELKRGYMEGKQALRLLHFPNKRERGEDWTLYVKGNLIELWHPKSEGEDKETRIVIPKIILSVPNIGHPYLVEKAYSGRDEISAVLMRYPHNSRMRIYAGIINHIGN